MCVFTELPTKKQQLQALNLLVLLLPDANRDTLKVDPHSEWIFTRRNFPPGTTWKKQFTAAYNNLSFCFASLRPWWSSSSVWLTIRPITKWPSTMSPLSWHPTSSCSRGSAPRSPNSRSFRWRPARPTSSGCWLDTRTFCGRWGSKKSPLAWYILPNLCQCQHSVPALVWNSQSQKHPDWFFLQRMVRCVSHLTFSVCFSSPDPEVHRDPGQTTKHGESAETK